jgi:hypothetical protein
MNDPIQEQLASVFSKYCKFAPASTALDNVKWFKCVSELGLVDSKTLTRADVDLIFTKVKAKGERRINLQGFRDALAMVARKKAGLGESEGDEVEQLTKMLAGKLTISPKAEAKTTADGGAADGGKAASGEKKAAKAGGKKKATGKTKAGAGHKSIFDKLTDTSQYTGSHKERFDKEGKGRGLAGRDSLSKGGVGTYHGGAVHDISQIMRPNLHQSPAKGANPNAAKATESTKTAPKKKGAAKKKKDGPSIFDKLTDSSLYTGAHKQRFDASGKGRGLDGRDSGGVDRSKVTDISQIVTRK